jgi:GNAT superfamily N-acetyltransferase
MLPPGTWLRAIAPGDKDLLQAGVAALSRESAYSRFLTGKSSLTTAELRYLTEVDGVDHIALLVLDDTDELIAVGRIVRDRTQPDTAELAVLVCDEWQRRGIGRMLTRELTLRSGVDRVAGTMLASNRAALALMRGIGPLEHSVIAGGVREVVARVSADIALAA